MTTKAACRLSTIFSYLMLTLVVGVTGCANNNVSITDKHTHSSRVKLTKDVNSWLSFSADAATTQGSGVSLVRPGENIIRSNIQISGPARLDQDFDLDTLDAKVGFRVLNTNLAQMKIKTGVEYVDFELGFDDGAIVQTYNGESVAVLAALEAEFPVNPSWSIHSYLQSSFAISGDATRLHKLGLGLTYSLNENIKFVLGGFGWNYSSDSSVSDIEVEVSGLSYGMEFSF